MIGNGNPEIYNNPNDFYFQSRPGDNQGGMYNNYTNPMNQNYPQNPDSNNFNSNMDNIVRSTLKSRGIVLKNDHNQSNLNNSPNMSYNRNQTAERKRALLNNIQQQMSLTNNSKLQELEKRKKEDEKYTNEMERGYPFGR